MPDTTTTGGAGEVLSANACAPLLSGVLLLALPLPPTPPRPTAVAPEDALPPASDALDEAGEELLLPAEDFSEPVRAVVEDVEPAFVEDELLPDLPLASLDLDRDRFCATGGGARDVGRIRRGIRHADVSASYGQ